jgi:predicted Fe-Mo cluster-binding NifX family protein
MAKWILVYGPDPEEVVFVRNEDLTGQGVVQTLQRRGCTDAIFSTIGDRALAHLEAAGIRGWYGDPDRTPAQLARELAKGQLQRATSGTHAAPRRHRRAR